MGRYSSGGRGQKFGFPYSKGLKDTNVNVLWRRKFSAGRVANMCIGPEGNVYVGVTRSDTLLYAFSNDGNLLWSISGVGIPIRGVPITVKNDGTIILSTTILSATTQIGSFTAAYTTQGEQIWKINIGSTYSLPAMSQDGIMYFCTYIYLSRGELVALNSTTGEIEWIKQRASAECSPAIDNDGNIYYSNIDDSALISIRPDGTERWRFTDSVALYVNGIVINSSGYIYFYNAKYSRLYCLNPEGKLIWKGIGGGNYAFDCPAITPKGNIVSASILAVWLYSPDGNLIWKLASPFEILSHPIVDKNGRIYLGSEGSENIPDFFRITESGEIDIKFNSTFSPINDLVWWLVLSDNKLFYYGYNEIVCVK